MLIELVEPIAILLSLALLQALNKRIFRNKKAAFVLSSGLLFGFIAILAMMMPYNFRPGFIFDSRSVIVSLSGYFYGPITAFIAATIAAIFRIYLGGAGAIAGALVVIVCAVSGATFYYFRKKIIFKSIYLDLYFFGFVTHLFAITPLLMLPADVRWTVIGNLSIPFFLIYPFATVFLGIILQNIEKVFATEDALKEKNKELENEVYQRKEAEAELQQSKNNLQAIFEQAAVGVARLGPDGIWLEVNKKFCEIVGYPEEELLLKKFQDITHPDDLKSNLVYVNQLLKGEIKTFSIKKRYFKKNSDIVWVNLTVSLVRDINNNPDFFVSVIEDITESKQAEERSRHQQHLLEVSQQLGRIGTWEIDIINNRLIWTDENCRIFGVPPGSEVDYETFLSKVHPEDLEYVDQQWKAAMQGHSYDIEHRLLVDGVVSWVREKADLTFNQDGEVIYAIGFTQDITGRKLAEFETQRLAENLKEKNTELERFIYTVSHDLKSPLVTISGFCSIAQESLTSGDKEQCQKSLDYISHASKRMEQLLGELLDISRVGVTLNPSETLNLGVLIKEAMENVSGVISENKTNVEVEPALPDVTVDNKYFLQVIENLIVNASKFSRSAKGNSHVNIGVIQKADEIICYVKDNGIGVEAQYLEKVFGLFEKLDIDSDSSGVGLAIVKRIIESHGGRVWAESEGLGRGTTFFFTLPVAKP